MFDMESQTNGELQEEKRTPSTNLRMKSPRDLTRQCDTGRKPRIMTLSVCLEEDELLLDLNKCAVIVIDMQNHFLHEKGAKGLIGEDLSNGLAIIPALNHLVGSLRGANVPIVWVNWGNRTDLLSMPASVMTTWYHGDHTKLTWKSRDSHGARIFFPAIGSWDAQVHQEVDYQKELDIWVDKIRFSGFYGTDLDGILRRLGIQTIFFTGTKTDICVFQTLVDANYRGYDCILVKDCCATSSPEFCVQSVHYHVKHCYGFVAASSTIVKAVAM